MKRSIVAGAIVLLGCLPAMAEDDQIDCNRSDLDQMSLNLCAERSYREVDAKLNEVYRTLMKKYDRQNQALLLASERAWLAYRDAECTFETAPTQNGSVHSLVYYSCLGRKTTARVKELNEQLNCQEGNLSCNAAH